MVFDNEKMQLIECGNFDDFSENHNLILENLKTDFEDVLDGKNENFLKAFYKGDISYYQLHKQGKKEGNNKEDYELLKKITEERNINYRNIIIGMIEVEMFKNITLNDNIISIDLESGIQLSLIRKLNISNKVNFSDIEKKDLLTVKEFEDLSDFFYGNTEVLKYILRINSEYIWLEGGMIGHIGNNKNSGRIQNNPEFNKKSFTLAYIEKN